MKFIKLTLVGADGVKRVRFETSKERQEKKLLDALLSGDAVGGDKAGNNVETVEVSTKKPDMLRLLNMAAQLEERIARASAQLNGLDYGEAEDLQVVVQRLADLIDAPFELDTPGPEDQNADAP